MAALKIVITASTDGAWFEGLPAEAQTEYVMDHVALKVANGRTEGKVLDGNGNTIGEFEIVRKS